MARKYVFTSLIFLICFWAAVAPTRSGAAVRACDIGTPTARCAGGGGEIPAPLTYNERVELADGEFYLLIGTVFIDSALQGRGNRAYLEVDLKEHPWLATTKRSLSPRYLLEGPVSYWKNYKGSRITLSCKAKVRAVISETGEPMISISLNSLEDPIR